ncbi:hypothetical protein Pcinc_015928 [Petrolisthes cinctipes]|uniref:Uncharacterized protein n=1 Tax=Petrolisthes cinctipes TaxID=88211 RepID=A0AAE1KP92_PETCI|nr:hypothetical protein Pcinc_015928 [Petrolisthes cinctipes]
MAGVSVIQEARAVRHTPLPPILPEIEPATNPEELTGDVQPLSSQSTIVGGFVGDGQLAWRAVGPTVEIIETSTGSRKAAWTFGVILHNSAAKVTSVCGVGQGSVSHVVVGVDLGDDAKPQGLVALLSLYSSRLTRAFHFTHKVTSVVMVSGGEVAVDGGTLVLELRPWRGILVVGTAHGTLHLLDLALDLGGNKVLSDEVSVGSLTRVVTPDPLAEQTRRNAILHHSHPTMCLSDGMMCGGQFQLIDPDDNVLFEVSSRLVTVTALAFLPQLASLVVGYSFGAFQIINLSTLTIDCTSPYEENVPPVLSFACQEPENDPKNFVYLWLCRSWGSAENSQTTKGGPNALCTMYAMVYDNKVWIEGHGLWYQGLTSISPKFEFDAVGGVGLHGQPTKPSLVFAATCVHHTTSTAAAAAAAAAATGSVSALTTPDEDAGSVPEQSLCMFGWVGGILDQGAVAINYYLAVFDINQWYQAQMPPNLKLEEHHLCPYMSFHELDRVPWSGRPGQGEVVLGAAPRPASWARHTSRSGNDTDWYPAALSYDVFLVTSGGLVEYQCPSAQQAAVAFLVAQGPSAIVNPEDAYARCVFAGLLLTDSVSRSSSSAMVSEREALLNVALDQQLVSLLVQCVSEFSEGRFTSLGCSLPSLLDWAWSRVTAIKNTNDTLCLPLFDPECGVVSSDNITSIHQNLTSLASLTTVVTAIRDFAHTNLITLQGAGELKCRVQVVGLVRQHLTAVLWFYHCGLLSSGPMEDTPEEQPAGVPFPADLLARIYHNRRLEIQRLSTSLSGKEILMIDGLLEEAGGAEGTGGSSSSIGQAWQEEGSSDMYPPPSLHALLSIFLLPDVATTTKHRIVQYLFLDLASLLTDGYVRVVEELVKYPSSFSLSPSLIKLTQAFWLLDHKDFQEALNVLLDPLVNTNDLSPWQHRRIMKAFLYQGESGRALRYAQLRQPPMVDPDDIRLHLTLLLANGLIREAFHFQRTHRIRNNAHDLLNHLFHGCEQLGKLESIIHLPLCPLEESALVSYLHTSASTSAHDYLLVYYLQRAKYDEAATLQDNQYGSCMGTGKKRQGARSALVHGYLTHLPDVASKLALNSSRKTSPAQSTYVKPQPLSAQIRLTTLSPRSRATSLREKLSTHSPSQQQKPQHEPFTPFRTVAQRRHKYQPTESQDIIPIAFSAKNKSLSRDASHVVFPSRIETSLASFLGGGEEEEEEKRAESSGLLFSPIPSKRGRFSESSLLTDGTRSFMEMVQRKYSNLQGPGDVNLSVSQTMSADVLSLLQTPKVKHKRKPVTTPAKDATLIDTPQSILKVRQMVQRPISPSAASDASIPVFPKLSAKKANVSIPDDTVASKPSETSMTPKQLRFHLPKTRREDEQAGKDEDDILQPSDNMDDDYDDNEAQDAVEEDDDDVDVVDRPHDEMQESGRFALLPRPSISDLKVNPLRHPDSGIPTPRQPLHSKIQHNTAIPLALSDVSRDEVHTQETEVEEEVQEEEEETIRVSSREASATEMFYSFEEEEEEEVMDIEEKNAMVKENVREAEGEEETEDEVEDEDLKNEEERMAKEVEDEEKTEEEELTEDEEEVETEAAERSKELEASEDYSSQEEDNDKEREEEEHEDDSMSGNGTQEEEGENTLTKMHLELSSVSKERQNVSINITGEKTTSLTANTSGLGVSREVVIDRYSHIRLSEVQDSENEEEHSQTEEEENRETEKMMGTQGKGVEGDVMSDEVNKVDKEGDAKGYESVGKVSEIPLLRGGESRILANAEYEREFEEEETDTEKLQDTELQREDTEAQKEDTEAQEEDTEAQEEDTEAQEVDTEAQEVDIDAQEEDIDAQEEDIDAQEVDIDAQEVDIDAQEVDIDAQEVDIDEEDIDVQEEDIDAQEVDIEAQDVDIEAQDVDIEAQDVDIEAQDVDIEAQDVDIEAQEEDIDAQEEDIEAQELGLDVIEEGDDCNTLSPKEEAMIEKAVREGQDEEKGYLKSNRLEQFSPLHFSDSEEEEEKEMEKEEEDEVEKEEVEVEVEVEEKKTKMTKVEEGRENVTEVEDNYLNSRSEQFSPLCFSDSEDEDEEAKEMKTEMIIGRMAGVEEAVDGNTVNVEKASVEKVELRAETMDVEEKAFADLEGKVKESGSDVEEGKKEGGSDEEEGQKEVKEGGREMEEAMEEVFGQDKLGIQVGSGKTKDGESLEGKSQLQDNTGDVCSSADGLVGQSGEPETVETSAEDHDIDYGRKVSEEPTEMEEKNRESHNLVEKEPEKIKGRKMEAMDGEDKDSVDDNDVLPSSDSSMKGDALHRTPVRHSIQHGDIPAEILTRSERKINLVPVPLTRSRPSTPASQLAATPVRRSRRLSGAAPDMGNVVVKLELSPEPQSPTPSAEELSALDVLSASPVLPSTPTRKAAKSTEKSSETVTLLNSSNRKSTNKSIAEDTLETIAEEAEIDTVAVAESQETAKAKTRLRETPPRSPLKDTPTKTAASTRRKSRRKSIGVEALEVIPENAEISLTNNSPTISSDASPQLSVTATTTPGPTRRSRRLSGKGVAKTPVTPTPQRSRRKSVSEEAVVETPATPSRRGRKRSMSEDDEVETRTPLRRSRRKSVSEEAEVETHTPLRRSRRKSVSEEDLLETHTPSRRSRRKSVSEEAEVETHTPLRRSRRKSVSEEEMVETPTTPSRRGRRKSVSEESVVKTPATPSRRDRRRSVSGSDAADNTGLVRTHLKKVGKAETQSLSVNEKDTIKATRLDSMPKRSRKQSHSEDEKPRTRHASSGSEAMQNSPESLSARSADSGSVTSIKDTESSDEEKTDGRKRARSTREYQEGSRSKKQKVKSSLVSEGGTERKYRRLTVSSSSIVIPVDDHIVKTRHTSSKALKLYSESDDSSGPSQLAPELSQRVSRRSSHVTHGVADTSVLLLGGPKAGEEDDDEEMVLPGGLDSEEDEAEEPRVLESPEMELNLLDVPKRKRMSSLSHLMASGAGTRVKRRPPSTKSLKLYRDSSQEEEINVVSDQSSDTKQPRRSVRKFVDTTVLELKDIKPETQSQSVGSEDEQGKDIEECVEESAMVPQLGFAEPQFVASSRKSRALESLTSEAVEFLFSPPQPAGRIVKHHTRVEESKKPSSSD